MKKLFVLFGLLLAATMIFAQAPQAFNYQAVVRDADGNLLQNQAVGIKISLLQGSATGQEVYAETHAVTTNQFGQVDLKIGTGTILTGQFYTIAWNTGNYHLQLSVDLSGGANYQIMGTTQMLAVPYALYAEEGSGWKKNEIGPFIEQGCLGLGIAPYISSSSNVKLEVFKDSSSIIRIISNGHGDNLSSIILKNNLLGWSIGTSEGLFGTPGSLGIRTYNTTTGTYINRFIIQQDGNVGIGVTDPNRKLDINGSINLRSEDGDYIGLFQNDNVNLTLGSVSGSQPRIYLHGSSSPISPGKIAILIPGNITLGSVSGSEPRMYFYSSTSTSTPGSIYIAAPQSISLMGNIGINTTNPTYPLTVNGTIRSKKVIVDTGWSDFVFEDDYSLMPLHQLDKFIEENKHLPEIPSAKEVEENGLSLGDMDAKLLQKIEELTLYTIEQQKLIEELVKQNEELVRRVKKIERRKK